MSTSTQQPEVIESLLPVEQSDEETIGVALLGSPDVALAVLHIAFEKFVLDAQFSSDFGQGGLYPWKRPASDKQTLESAELISQLYQIAEQNPDLVELILSDLALRARGNGVPQMRAVEFLLVFDPTLERVLQTLGTQLDMTWLLNVTRLTVQTKPENLPQVRQQVLDFVLALPVVDQKSLRDIMRLFVILDAKSIYAKDERFQTIVLDAADNLFSGIGSSSIEAETIKMLLSFDFATDLRARRAAGKLVAIAKGMWKRNNSRLLPQLDSETANSFVRALGEDTSITVDDRLALHFGFFHQNMSTVLGSQMENTEKMRELSQLEQATKPLAIELIDQMKQIAPMYAKFIPFFLQYEAQRKALLAKLDDSEQLVLAMPEIIRRFFAGLSIDQMKEVLALTMPDDFTALSAYFELICTYREEFRFDSLRLGDTSDTRWLWLYDAALDRIPYSVIRTSVLEATLAVNASTTIHKAMLYQLLATKRLRPQDIWNMQLSAVNQDSLTQVTTAYWERELSPYVVSAANNATYLIETAMRKKQEADWNLVDARFKTIFDTVEQCSEAQIATVSVPELRRLIDTFLEYQKSGRPIPEPTILSLVNLARTLLSEESTRNSDLFNMLKLLGRKKSYERNEVVTELTSRLTPIRVLELVTENRLTPEDVFEYLQRTQIDITREFLEQIGFVLKAHFYAAVSRRRLDETTLVDTGILLWLQQSAWFQKLIDSDQEIKDLYSQLI